LIWISGIEVGLGEVFFGYVFVIGDSLDVVLGWVIIELVFGLVGKWVLVEVC